MFTVFSNGMFDIQIVTVNYLKIHVYIKSYFWLKFQKLKRLVLKVFNYLVGETSLVRRIWMTRVKVFKFNYITVGIWIPTIWIPETFQNLFFFEVQISNGFDSDSNGQFTCYFLCTRSTIWILDQFIRKQDGVRYSNGLAV